MQVRRGFPLGTAVATVYPVLVGRPLQLPLGAESSEPVVGVISIEPHATDSNGGGNVVITFTTDTQET